jgi:hypothetical protein
VNYARLSPVAIRISPSRFCRLQYRDPPLAQVDMRENLAPTLPHRRIDIIKKSE